MSEASKVMSDRLRPTSSPRRKGQTDGLSNLLASYRSGSAFLGTAVLHRPWGIGVEPQRHSAIHLVLDGACWLGLSDHDEPIRLAQGDVALVTSGVGHKLSDPPSATVVPIGAAVGAGLREPSGSRPGSTTLLCAKYQVDEPGPHPMAALMPPVVHLTREEVMANEPLRLILELLRVEAQDDRAKSGLVASRLLDSTLVLLLRAWIDSRPEGDADWFGALKDSAIARALRLIHEQPAASWTIAKLAEHALLSRATFARRFVQLVGEPPLAYIAHLRMKMAAKAFRETDRSITEIGLAVGYESGAAFSKAFSRVYGQSPGRYRDGNSSTTSAGPPPRRENGRPAMRGDEER